MITLRLTQENELKTLVEMERQAHANKFVNSVGLESHKKNFKDPNIIYLSIENSEKLLSGYFILVNEIKSKSVEFHRIVIDKDSRGIGQFAIKKMETYCSKMLNAKRIWLDVYEENVVGKHIYEKLGYTKFKETLSNRRTLLFYQKNL